MDGDPFVEIAVLFIVGGAALTAIFVYSQMFIGVLTNPLGQILVGCVVAYIVYNFIRDKLA